MYVREKKHSKHTSVQLVKSVRDGDKVRQKVVRYIGSARDADSLEKLRMLAQIQLEQLRQDSVPSLFPAEELAKAAVAAPRHCNKRSTSINLEDLDCQRVSVAGIHDVYGQVYDELFGDLLSTRRSRAAPVLREVVLARIANPCSKRSTVAELERRFGVSIALSKVYRMMDRLTPEVLKKIERRAWHAARQLEGGEIRLTLFDCTTVYFESMAEDELRSKGYSKDGKPHRVQVLLGLLSSCDGQPLGWRIYPGSAWEGAALADAVEKIRCEYEVQRVVVVADAGMDTADNRALLDSCELPYVLGARLKSQSRSVQRQVLDASRYRNFDGPNCEPGSRWQEIPLPGGPRLVVHYSPKRARKDARDRERGIEKLTRKFGRGKSLKKLASPRGYARFLKVQGDAEVSLDRDKIAEAAQWDGLAGIVSSIAECPAPQLLSHYRRRWRIENTFRVAKHDLKVRPVFHWSQPRIQAHFAICFMALCCVRNLEARLRLMGKHYSPKQIHNELCNRLVCIHRNRKTGQRYAVPAGSTSEQKAIYRAVGLPLATRPIVLDS